MEKRKFIFKHSLSFVNSERQTDQTEKNSHTFRWNWLSFLITSGITLITFWLMQALSWIWSWKIYLNGTGQAILASTFDVTVAIIIILAGLSLIGSFLTRKPKFAYGGIHVYVWLVSLAFSYILSGKERIHFYLINLPRQDSFVYSLAVATFISLLLLFSRKYVMKFIKAFVRGYEHAEPHKDEFSYDSLSKEFHGNKF